MNISLTREKLIWGIIAIFAVVGGILGIVATSKDIMMGTIKATNLMGENYFKDLPSEIKTHTTMVVVGGFIAIFSGVIAIGTGAWSTKKNIEIDHKITWVGGSFALISFVMGVTAMAMNADLNDASWFVKLATSNLKNII